MNGLVSQGETPDAPVAEWMDGPVPAPVAAAPLPELAAAVAAAVAGDERATGRLLGLIRPLLVRYCRARVGRQERSFASADDVAQEICLAVLTALPGYQDQGRPFLAFVYGIAAHKVADAHRAAARNRAEPVAEVPDTPELDAGPEQRAVHEELSARMAELLRVLPVKQREILVLRVMVGMSAEETAVMVGSTAGAVRVAQHRALTRLRSAARQHGLVSAAAHPDRGEMVAQQQQMRTLLSRSSFGTADATTQRDWHRRDQPRRRVPIQRPDIHTA
jgi:RNA polymerase sigma-70 factor (ECF subfamily)